MSLSRTWCCVKKRFKKKLEFNALTRYSGNVQRTSYKTNPSVEQAFSNTSGNLETAGQQHPELAPNIESYDSPDLARAKASWYFGEWDSLANLDLEILVEHSDRGRLALLVASAQQQIDEPEAALKSARCAVAWGCSAKLVAQVLIAGVHNTLGRATALAGQGERAAAHFQSAVSVGGSDIGADELMGHTRGVREMIKLGLLPQAAALMDQSLTLASIKTQKPRNVDARLKALGSELELLRGGLNLAASRAQLHGSTTGRSLEQLAASQIGQDLWVLAKTGFKRNGYFVEFGATDGVLLSNTLLLERQFEWRGICAEPHPRFFAQLQKNRACIVTNACIAGQSGRQVEFILADEYGGIADFAAADNHADKRDAFRALGHTMQVTTISLHDLLTMHNAPHRIDYLSIDTEGSEFDILKDFPFYQWHIQCITVEHNFSAIREPIQQLLEPLGYQRIEAQWDDWYFLNENK